MNLIVAVVIFEMMDYIFVKHRLNFFFVVVVVDSVMKRSVNMN